MFVLKPSDRTTLLLNPEFDEDAAEYFIRVVFYQNYFTKSKIQSKTALVEDIYLQQKTFPAFGVHFYRSLSS